MKLCDPMKNVEQYFLLVLFTLRKFVNCLLSLVVVHVYGMT